MSCKVVWRKFLSLIRMRVTVKLASYKVPWKWYIVISPITLKGGKLCQNVRIAQRTRQEPQKHGTSGDSQSRCINALSVETNLEDISWEARCDLFWALTTVVWERLEWGKKQRTGLRPINDPSLSHTLSSLSPTFSSIKRRRDPYSCLLFWHVDWFQS